MTSGEGEASEKRRLNLPFLAAGLLLTVIGLIGLSMVLSSAWYIISIVPLLAGVAALPIGAGLVTPRRAAASVLRMMPGPVSRKIRSSLKPEIVTQDGLKWYVTRDLRYGYAISHDRYEHNLHEYFFRFMPPNGVFLDIGAGAGKYSVLLASKGATVYAWEPNPYNLTVFRENLKLNNLNVTIYEAALGEEDKEGKLHLSALASMVTEGEGAPISIRTLDSYGLEKADLVKIDTEGQEFPILKGAAKTVQACQPTLIVELHPHLVAGTRERCQALLDTWNYVYKDIGKTKSGNSEYLLAVPKARAAQLQ